MYLHYLLTITKRALMQASVAILNSPSSMVKIKRHIEFES